MYVCMYVPKPGEIKKVEIVPLDAHPNA